MKALHRTIAGTAFGVLAAAIVAASAAYACHPGASIALSAESVGLNQYTASAGQHVRVTGNGFDPNTMVKIWFGTQVGDLRWLGETLAQPVDPKGGPQADLVVQIPEGAAPRTYVLAASQEPAKTNPGYFRATVTVEPTPSSPGEVSGPNGGDSQGPPPSTAPIGPQDASAGGSAAEATSVTVAQAPGAVFAEPSSPAGAASPSAGPIADAAVLQDRLSRPGPEGRAQAPAGPSFGAPGAPPAEDLWSGVDPAQVPAMLDAPTPPPQQDGVAVGMALLGFGGAVLGGIGLAAGRRRLALATRR